MANPAISYCCVANQYCVLAESNVDKSDTKLPQLAQRIVSGLSFDKDESDSVQLESRTFSYLVQDELALVCVADASYGQR